MREYNTPELFNKNIISHTPDFNKFNLDNAFSYNIEKKFEKKKIKKSKEEVDQTLFIINLENVNLIKIDYFRNR
jgi:hypothetical protein